MYNLNAFCQLITLDVNDHRLRIYDLITTRTNLSNLCNILSFLVCHGVSDVYLGSLTWISDSQSYQNNLNLNLNLYFHRKQWFSICSHLNPGDLVEELEEN